MIPTKLWGYVGIGAAVLVLVGIVLWQMNSLITREREAGAAQARIAELEKTLEEERGTCRGSVDSLTFLLEGCKFDLGNYVDLSDQYRTEVEALKLRPPRRVEVRIEAQECVNALAEGHIKAIAMMEVRRAENPTP